MDRHFFLHSDGDELILLVAVAEGSAVDFEDGTADGLDGLWRTGSEAEAVEAAEPDVV